jgi:hypothetical protein
MFEGDNFTSGAGRHARIAFRENALRWRKRPKGACAPKAAIATAFLPHAANEPPLVSSCTLLPRPMRSALALAIPRTSA